MNSLIWAIVLSAALAAADPLLVELLNGVLRGQDKGSYYSYESIPYAQPPVGDLRLEDPVPYTQRWESIFDATRPPTECLQWNELLAQPDKLTGSEDCLTVSIYRPKNTSRIDYPVVAHIFCSDWSFGSPLDDGVEFFMDSGNVIVAMINYRVGALGFLSTDDEVIPGNFGLKDQHMAIHWIKDNIARFGGDPNKIVLLGFGTGGSSVHLQLMKKDVEQLVRGAISISGTAMSPFAVQDSGSMLAFHYGKLLSCKKNKTSAELKACFKKTKAHNFVRIMQKFKVFDNFPLGPFTPVVESRQVKKRFLAQMPLEIIKSGKFAQVPWLASYTSENGVYNAAQLLKKGSNGKEIIEELNTRWDKLAPYFFAYPFSYDQSERDDRSQSLRRKYLGYSNFSVDTYFDLQRMFTNELYKNGIELALDMHRSYGSSPVYAYVYSNAADHSFARLLSKRSDLFLGTGMGDDYFLYWNSMVHGPLRSDEKVISWKLIKMVEQFAENGSLAYGNCAFPDNRAEANFQLVSITRTHCEVIEADTLPDIVSPKMPESPKVIF